MTTEQLHILIQFGEWTSEKDVEDLKILLEDISSKYHFRWNVVTYFKRKLNTKEVNSTGKELKK